MIHSNTWNYLTLLTYDYKSNISNIYVCKADLALNNQQWLIYHKTKPILLIASRALVQSEDRLGRIWTPLSASIFHPNIYHDTRTSYSLSLSVYVYVNIHIHTRTLSIYYSFICLCSVPKVLFNLNF